MIKLNAIPLDYEPRQKILPKLPICVRGPEMTESESAFLCGLLKKRRPKKFFEVGISGGGTTSIILQALEDIGQPYEMHSTDIAEKFYYDNTKTIGFMATFAKENNLIASPYSTLSGTHKFYLGKVLPQVIDEIGGDIEFVILDTIHRIPGESLDFLAVLPYLTADAIVVLHDISLNQLKLQYFNCNATCVLFSAVTAEKFVNFIPDEDNSKFRYPNIAAFQINEQTAANIENVFLSLILRWSYFPSEAELITYRKFYRRFYSEELCEIFQEAIDMNAFNFYLAQLAQRK